jgi:hypothetical protein
MTTKIAEIKAGKTMKTGAQRKREHDERKRDQGLVEFRAWVTEAERQLLREYLCKLRLDSA